VTVGWLLREPWAGQVRPAAPHVLQGSTESRVQASLPEGDRAGHRQTSRRGPGAREGVGKYAPGLGSLRGSRAADRGESEQDAAQDYPTSGKDLPHAHA
jgi:hypothetical protein